MNGYIECNAMKANSRTRQKYQNTRSRSLYGLVVLPVILLSLLLQGCRSPLLYGLELHNEGNENIADSSIKYGDRVLVYGNVVAHALRSYGTVQIAIPESATFYWKYDSGGSFEKTVPIRKYVKGAGGFQGHIMAKLKPDGSVEIVVTAD